MDSQQDVVAKTVSHPTPPSEGEDAESADAFLSGTLRGVIRSITRKLGYKQVAHPKLLARKADVLSDFLELRKSTQLSLQSTPGIEEESCKKINWKKRMMTFISSGSSFIRSSLAGGAVFTTYDFLALKYAPLAATASMKWEERTTSLPPAVAFCAGGVGGALHASIVLLWERATAEITKRVKPLMSSNHFFSSTSPPPLYLHTTGTLLAHSVSHAILFSSYEYAKTQILRQLSKRSISNLDDREFLLYSSSALAGAIAGLLSEVFGFYSLPFSEFGFGRNSRIVFRSLGYPPTRSLFSSIIPSSLGFLAYEYGRSSLWIEEGS